MRSHRVDSGKAASDAPVAAVWPTFHEALLHRQAPGMAEDAGATSLAPQSTAARHKPDGLDLHRRIAMAATCRFGSPRL